MHPAARAHGASHLEMQQHPSLSQDLSRHGGESLKGYPPGMGSATASGSATLAESAMASWSEFPELAVSAAAAARLLPSTRANWRAVSVARAGKQTSAKMSDQATQM